MRHAAEYKTEHGLYKATIKAIEAGGFPRVWFCQQAISHCKAAFPELLPQLERLIYGEQRTLADLQQAM